MPESPTGCKTVVLYLCSLSLINKRFSTMGKETDTSNYSAKSGPVNSLCVMILTNDENDAHSYERLTFHHMSVCYFYDHVSLLRPFMFLHRSVPPLRC